jgi:4-amino-4-deoxy-L-arabinose transferase-like glycosyltransferase
MPSRGRTATRPEGVRSLWLLVLILLVATALRLSGVAWDGGIGAHPDERYVVGTAEGMGWPDRLNPLALEPDFSYGHLPVVALSLLGGRDRLLAGRLLAGLFDVGTVALAAALGSRLGGRRVGLLAAAFLAVTLLHVQQAHFCTVDPFLAFFATGALVFATRLASRGRLGDAVLTGTWCGLALGCKASAALLALPLTVACSAGPGPAAVKARRGLCAAGAALAAFVVTNPAVLSDLPRYVANLRGQAALARGSVLVPYTLQYRGALPYLYPIAQQMSWGMGPVLGFLCFAGLATAVWRAVRRPPAAEEWVALAWAVPFFAFTGGLYVKFPRYLLPLTPLLAVYAAWLAAGTGQRLVSSGWTTWLRRSAIVLAFCWAGVASLALVASYRQPHPWNAASDWLGAHVPPGGVIAVEEWDHPLPVGADGYEMRLVPILDEDTPRKWALIDAALAEADVVVIASRRGYGALSRWPRRFSQSVDYYRSLLAGERGFRVAACFGRWPAVGPVALADDPLAAAGLSVPSSLGCQPLPPVMWLPRLDESFVVYDHPLVVILRRSTGVSP